MKRNCLIAGFLSLFALGASAQTTLPINVTEDLFNADSVFIVKDRVEWDATNNGIKEEALRDGCNTIFTFNGTPGYLKLGHFRSKYGKNHNMLIQESADGENFTDLYNGPSSTSWNDLNAALSKDTRYIRLRYTADYKFGDVNSRQAYWCNISVTEPISEQESVDTVMAEFGENVSYAVNLAYSNPSGNLVLSSNDSHIRFSADGAETKIISDVAGKEGTASFDVFYDTTQKPAQVDTINTEFYVSDAGNEGYKKTYKLVAIVSGQSIKLPETTGSVFAFVGDSTTTTFTINASADVKAEDIAVTSQSADVTVESVEAGENNDMTVTLNYKPTVEAENDTVNITVAYGALELEYQLAVTAYRSNYTVASVEDFNKFATVSNKGYEVSAELSQDITFTEETPNVQLVAFSGILDGKCHTINGYNTDDSAALFAPTATGAVKNLALNNQRLLPSSVESTDAEGNGLGVEFCYGSNSDNGEALLMNYNYMNTSKVKYVFTRVRSTEDIDPTTGKGVPAYLLKLGDATLTVLNADKETVAGEPSCFAMWQMLNADTISNGVFGMTIGQDEMPSFKNDDNAIMTASHFANVEDAKASAVYVQNGKFYDTNLKTAVFGSANDFVVVPVSSDSIAESFKSMPANVVTSDGKAAKVVITDGKDYVFPANSGLESIVADSVVYTRSFNRSGAYAPVCLPFNVTSYILDAASKAEGDNVDVAFVAEGKEVISESKSQIILQSLTNPAYADCDYAKGKFVANTPFFFAVSNSSANGNINVTFVGEDATLNAAQPQVADNAPFNGTFKNTSVQNLSTEGTDVYTIVNGTDDSQAAQCFVKASDDAVIPAFSAYALIDKTITADGTKQFTLKIDNGVVDGLCNAVSVDEVKTDGSVYNVNGQRVSTLRAGQIYIQNGKKFVLSK